MKLLASLIVFFFSALSSADDPTSVRDQAHNFLEKNLMGRTQEVTTEGTVTAEGETYLVKFNAKITWGKLEKTKQGVIFEETREIKQSSTKQGTAGSKVEPVVSDRVVVHRYILSERRTTKSLVGTTMETSNSLEGLTGDAFVTMLEISPDNKAMYIYQSLAGFSETSLDGKTVIPVSMASHATYFLDSESKLTTNETLKFYKVDVNNDFAKEEISRFNLTAVEGK